MKRNISLYACQWNLFLLVFEVYSMQDLFFLRRDLEIRLGGLWSKNICYVSYFQSKYLPGNFVYKKA